MIDIEWARSFAEEWIDSWNSHDLERILSHYTNDFEMSSPLIAERGYDPSGTLKGKEKVRPYWADGLSRTPHLHFELLEVLIGVESIVLYYRNQTGKRAAEHLLFNEQRLVTQGKAHYTAG